MTGPGDDAADESAGFASGLRDVREPAKRLREHAAAIMRIARWETSRGVAGVDRRTLAVGLVGVLLAGAVAGAVATTGGSAALDEDIYRVGVPADSPYRQPVTESAPLAARPPSSTAFARGRLDVLVPPDPVHGEGTLRVAVAEPSSLSPQRAATLSDRGTVLVADSRKGRAALAAFREAVSGYTDGQMAAEENRSAAFPVVVTLTYVSRSDVRTATSSGAGGDGATADGAASGDSGDAEVTPAAGDGSGDGGQLRAPDLGVTGLFATGSTGSPAEIQPPFPFASLVLAFLFLVPMNFVVQAYGSTILDERIDRRGELLLVAPIAPADIVAGKTVPYFLAAVALTTVIAAVVGGSVLSVAAVVPIALVYLAATFVAGMFARSFKELTFVTVSVSVFLTAYTFVPAIFTEVTPIALISPLTLVVRDLQGGGATLATYAFSTGPFYLVGGLLFLLGTGVYREEDMFTQRPVPLKFLDALDAWLTGRWSVALASALSIPFVFVAELLAIALLFALPFGVSLPLLLVAVAGVEELAKSLHVYAGFHSGRFERGVRSALGLGALSGLGFFFGEKVTVVVQVVGLPAVPLGRAAFAPSGIGLTAGAALLVAPLALHAVTAAITALGASRQQRLWYGGSLVAATAVHAAYNLSVVVLLG